MESDSEDEIPGSLNCSDQERNSSAFQLKRNLNSSKYGEIIDATDSEEDEEYEDEEEEENVPRNDNQEDDEISHFNHSSVSDYDSTLNNTKTNEAAGSSDSDVAVFPKKITRKNWNKIEDSSTDEDTQQRKPQRKSDLYISMNDSYSKIVSDKHLQHSTVFEIEDSSHDESSEHLPLSISDSSAPEIAISLAKEATINGTDPILLQQRALNSCKMEQLQSELVKTKLIYNTANRDQLPDNGEKLRIKISSLEKQLEDLSIEQRSIHSDSLDIVQLSSANSSANIIQVSSSNSGDFSDAYVPTNFGEKGNGTGTGTGIGNGIGNGNEKNKKEMGKRALATFEKEQALTVERITKLQQSLNRCPEENEEAENPRGLKTKLMPHQKHALAWMLWREKERPPGGLLADDMGLGKTLTMISLIVATQDVTYSDDSESEDEDELWSSNKKFARPKGGTLVVCPASLLDQWQNEIETRCRRGVLSVELHHGQRRETAPRRLAKNDVVLTTYQLVASEFKKNSILFKIRWKRIILDEAHVIRNHTGKISEAVCNLSARSRWALTGTPVHNKEQDLYALLKFIRVSPFNDLQVWKRWVDNKNATGLKRLSTVTKTLMLRRTKQELMSKGILEELPEKFVDTVVVNLDKEETKIYQAVLAFSKTLFAQFLTQRAEKKHMLDLNAGKFDKPSYLESIPQSHFAAARKQLLGRSDDDVKAYHILVLILRLRQICCHPGLIREMVDKAEAETNGISDDDKNGLDDLAAQVNNMTLFEDEENEGNDNGLFSLKNVVFDFIRPSSKIKAITSKVEDILQKGEKMIIVSEWTGMLEIVAQHLNNIEGATYEMFTGKVPIKKRQGIVDRFNDKNDDLLILLLSLTAGGVGLNLVGGNHLLLIDIHWNPQLESQAQDRIYRFGQRKDVHIYKFLCNETIEQRVKELQEKKLNLAEDIFTGHRRTSNKLSLDDLKGIFEL